MGAAPGGDLGTAMGGNFEVAAIGGSLGWPTVGGIDTASAEALRNSGGFEVAALNESLGVGGAGCWWGATEVAMAALAAEIPLCLQVNTCMDGTNQILSHPMPLMSKAN